MASKKKNVELDARAVALSLTGYGWQFDYSASPHVTRWLLRKNGYLVGWVGCNRERTTKPEWEGYYLQAGTAFSGYSYDEDGAKATVEKLALGHESGAEEKGVRNKNPQGLPLARKMAGPVAKLRIEPIAKRR